MKVNDRCFEHSRDLLRRVVQECNKLFHNAKLNGGDNVVLKINSETLVAMLKMLQKVPKGSGLST